MMRVRAVALLSLTGLLSGCGHRAPDSLLLIEVDQQGGCTPELCADRTARLEKLLTVQLALRSDCGRVHGFLSRDQWMLAKEPVQAKHWALTVYQGLEPTAAARSWRLSGPGNNYHGTGDPSQIIKAVCSLIT